MSVKAQATEGHAKVGTAVNAKRGNLSGKYLGEDKVWIIFIYIFFIRVEAADH